MKNLINKLLSRKIVFVKKSNVSKKSQGYTAFTLAEVLITLGIIGVVAAITTPVLMNRTQNKENEVAAKKMYSNLSNALGQVTQENGGVPYKCDFDYDVVHYDQSECIVFWDEMLSKFGSVKKCTGGVAAGCQPQYKNYAEVIAAGGAASSNSASGFNVTNNKSSYGLPDGSMIYSYNADLYEYGLFIIDTNGFKKPNKWGYDVFMLAIVRTGNNVRILDTVSTMWFAMWMCEKGGKTINDILSNN